MGDIRKQFSKEFKANVALAALRGDKTIGELCSEFSIHASRINLWKKVVKEGAVGLFSRGTQKGDRGQEDLIEDLYKNIGKLKVENDWLKKKLFF